MSDTTALSAAPPPSHGTLPPRPAPARDAADDIDLYSESPRLGTKDTGADSVENWFGKDGFDFKDLLDIVNPLQHLPVVGTIYRAVTGDTLEPGPRILGGTLFGGIGGFVASLANAVFENETGKDFGDTALAMITGDSAPTTAVASAAPASVAPAADPATAAKATTTTAHAAAITPTAPSPLAIAGHAKPHGMPLTASTAAAKEKEDAVSALLNAHAAVPATHIAGTTTYRSSLKMPDGRQVPITFKHRAAPEMGAAHAAAPAAQKAVATAQTAEAPAQKAVATAMAPQQKAPAGNTPRSHYVAAGPPNPGTEEGVKKAGAGGFQADVPVLMRQALDKYEALMKSRTDPSISGKI